MSVEKDMDNVNLSMINRKDSANASNDSIYNGLEGALVLGKKSTSEVKYHTRYAIERKQQNHESFKESLEEFFLPCCSDENNENNTIFKKIISFVTSEPFILTLHLTAVILGVLKILLEVREKNGEEIEEAHSALECIGVCIVLGLRTWIINNNFHEIKTLRINIEKADEKDTIRGQKLKVFVRIYSAIMIFFCLTSIGCTIAFKLLAHLGWTILSNNCLLAMGTGLFGIALSFTGRKLSKIKGDHQKLLICEMSLLLSEVLLAKDKTEKDAMNKKVEKFLKALKDTPEFEKPQYLNCDRKITEKEISMLQIVSYL
ncbi:unnamed protein product [Dimorphilus gyrociliatus]|uniref:Uncharacterized protein n=1 Tax=Dimorphilus gyrociliatus TaxID=2664684 RepID=A0A7I8V7G0_9ANNE|nr:unnamed protein product [Dimorphilus gyrociliatus]